MMDILVKDVPGDIIQAVGLDIGKGPILRDRGGRTLSNHALMLIVEGDGYFEDEDTPLTTLRKGMIFFQYPGKWHNFDPNPGTVWTEYWILFDGTLAENLYGPIIPKETPVYRLDRPESLKEDYEELYDLWFFRNPGYREYSCFLLHRMLMDIYLQVHQLSFQRHDDMVQKTKQAMEEELGNEEFDLKEFAENEQLGYQNLRKRFKKDTNMSPHQYFLMLKVNRAKQLLLRPKKSVREIAATLGFQDPYYFSRLFKKKAGLSPEHFRRYFMK